MKSAIFILLLLLQISLSLKAQDFKWAIQPGGKTNADYNASYDGSASDQDYAVMTDALGNVYNIGAYDWGSVNGNTDFDPGIDTVQPVYPIPVAAFIQKIDSLGNLLWLKTFEGDFVNMYSTAFDATGNIVITGTFLDTLDADPGPGTYSLIAPPSTIGIYILKLDTAGNFMWAGQLSGSDNLHTRSQGICVNAADEIILTGSFKDTLDVEPGPGITNLYTNGIGTYVIAMDAAGNLLWSKQLSGNLINSYIKPATVKTDGSGNIFIGGSFHTIVDVDPSGSIFELGLTDTSGYNCFVLKLDNTGNFIWADEFTGDANNWLNDLMVDNANDLVITGYTTGTMDFDPGAGTSFNVVHGSRDAFLFKLTNAGAFVWYKTMGGNEDDYGSALAIDGANNYYLSGSFRGTVDLDPGFPVQEYFANGNDQFVQEYNSDGLLDWIYTTDGIPADFFVRGEALATFGHHVYIAGRFQSMEGPWHDAFDIDPTVSASMLHYDGAGANGFLEKISHGPCSGFKVGIDTVVHVTCTTNGSATGEGLYGFAPYTYEWNTVPITPDSNAVFTTAGFYTLTATDSIGCVATKTIAVSGSSGNSVDTKDIMIFPVNIRPSVMSYIYLNVLNLGCDTSSGYLSFKHDNKMDILYSFPVPDSTIGDSLIWFVDPLNYDSFPFEVLLTVQASAIAVIWDMSVYTTHFEPTVTDSNMTDNTMTDTSWVADSFDPNIKSVYPEGACNEHYILPTQKLTYTVQFQNTGTADAINIYVLDTLDAQLDINSLQVIFNSHYMYTEILPGNILKFNFDNIYLPDSASDEPNSHGHFVYEIDMLPALPNGTLINNTAYIYFDENAPVVTNTVYNTVTSAIPSCTIGIHEETASNINFSVYPNPANSTITIATQKTIAQKISLVDVYGRTIKTVQPNSSQTIMDLQNLEAGIYFINVVNENSQQTVKVVKQ